MKAISSLCIGPAVFAAGLLSMTTALALPAPPATTNAAPAKPSVPTKPAAPATKTSAAPTNVAPKTNAPGTIPPPSEPAANVEIDKETGKPVVTTPSGLKYVDIVVGAGAEVKQGDHVAVKYVGKLADGTTFDASASHPEMGPTFNYEQGETSLIAGWTEGTSTMKVGGKRKLIIPPQLGYGLTGYGDTIPANATLIFEIELVAINNPAVSTPH